MNKQLMVCIAAATLAGAANAYVQSDAVQLLPADTLYSPATYHLHFGTRPADVLVNFDGGTMNYVTQTLDVTNEFLLAHPGDVVTANSFRHGVNAGNDPFSNPAAGSDFYMVGMVDTGFLDPGEPSIPTPDRTGYSHDIRFGWAHIQIGGNGTAMVLASAMAYGEGGIIVGTMQAVPEPASFALALMGLGLLALPGLRRQRQQDREPQA